MSGPAASAPGLRRVRVALVVVALGLAIELAAGLAWSPAAFIVSAAIGLPLVLAGAVLAFVFARRAR